MSAVYQLSDNERQKLGQTLLRVEGCPESATELLAKIADSKPDLVRWKFPASFTAYNDLLNQTGMHHEFAGAIRFLDFVDPSTPSIAPRNPATFVRYDGSSSSRDLLKEMISKCYIDDPLGMRASPTAARLVPVERELASMTDYFATQFCPRNQSANHFYFAMLEGCPAGFCALMITDEGMRCPLGGVLPEHARQGLFSDILLFSRKLAIEMGRLKINMGIRASNAASMSVFLKHAYGDTGRVTADFIEYVFYLFPNTLQKTSRA